jgi:tetratricopeptide (TPR) repeat protein
LEALAACGGLSKADKEYNRGVDLLREARIEEAIAAYDEAIRLDSTLAVAYHNRALAYENLGFVDRAVEDYNEAISSR